MQRAAKVTLKFTTTAKRNRLEAVLRRYRGAVNFFIARLWQDLPTTYHDLTDSLLSARYRSAALRQAEGVVSSTRKAAAATGAIPTLPCFHGSATLDTKFVTIEEGRGAFDLVVRISSLVAGERITIMTKATKVLRKCLAVPGPRLIHGCGLGDDYLTLWVELPNLPPKEEGDVLAVDIGVNKLLSDSDGNHYGTDFKAIRDKIRRRQPGSNGRQRAHRERDNFINRIVNQLPWHRLKAIGHERLVGLKRGKKPNRSKAFRKALSPWTYRYVIAKIGRKAQESRARPVENDPRNSSRQCPVCGMVSGLNRRGEKFRCVRCGHTADADTNGATNLLARTRTILRSVESPRLKKSMI